MGRQHLAHGLRRGLGAAAAIAAGNIKSNKPQVLTTSATKINHQIAAHNRDAGIMK